MSDRSPLDWRLELATARDALLLLSRRLGGLAALGVLARVAWDRLRGEPFAHLSSPEEEREELSRRQVGPAILLYRALCRRLPREQALALTQEIVVSGTLIFLRRAVGPFSREAIAALGPAEREGWVRAIGARFFNATLRWERVTAREVRFTVTACRFPELCRAAGAPELAPLFCQGDALFFGDPQAGTELLREQTIARGATECPFTIRWRE